MATTILPIMSLMPMPATASAAGNIANDFVPPPPSTTNQPAVIIDEIVIADCPSMSPGQLVERYRGYALGLAGKFAPRVQSMGSFAIEEIRDAALDGLLDAVGLYDPEDSRGAKFETYAYHFIAGRMIDRFAELLKFVSTSDYEFKATQGGPKEDRGKRISPATGGTTSAFTDDYLVSALSEIRRREQLISVMKQLQDDGLLTPIEKQIIEPLFTEGLDLEDVSELYNISISKLRVAVVKLLYKVRAAMRSDAAFPGKLFKIPFEDMPATSREAIALVRDTLRQLRDNASNRSGTPRNLADFKHFMPDLEYLSNMVGGGDVENRTTPAARVISIYRNALGLTNPDIAEALGMTDSSVGQMVNYGTLAQRQSPEKIRLLADTLNIDPTQILFRAIPELASLFEHTVYAGENVYLTFIDTPLPSDKIITDISRPSDSNASHAFGDIIRAYRLWSGIPSAADLGDNYKKIEMGGFGSVSATIALANAINMPLLLAVLGTWPELAELFDIIDSEGNILHKSKCEYSRIVIVLRTSAEKKEEPEPAEDGFASFAKWAISRKGPFATPALMAEYGLTPRVIAGMVAGRPPDPTYFRGLSRFLGLNPLEEMRMLAEILLLRGDVRRAELKQLIELARIENAQINLLQQAGWGELEDVATSMDMNVVSKLNDQLLSVFDTKKRPATVETAINEYIEGLRKFL